MCIQSSLPVICQSCGAFVDFVNEPPPGGIGTDDLLIRLHENQEPSPSEVEDLRKAIQVESDAIASLVKRIIPLKQRLHMIETSSQRKSSPLAPICRIPNELLDKIFNLACSSGWVYPDGHPNKTTYTALVLGQVCRYWRRFALNTPGLWSKLEVTLISSYNEWTVKDLVDVSPVFFLYLDRSKDHSLDVRLVAEDETTLKGITWSEKRILKALMANSSRFERFIVYVNDIQQYQGQFTSGVPDFSRLEYLKLSYSCGYFKTCTDNGWFVNAPSLKQLWLRAPFDFSPFNWGILEQVELVLYAESPQNILKVISAISYQAPRLKRLLCHSQKDLELEITQTYKFDMLEELYIVDALIGIIIAPKLRQLTVVADTSQEHPEFAARVYSFLTQSGTELVSLTVVPSFFDNPEYCSLCFAAVESLLEFKCHRLRQRTEHLQTVTHRLGSLLMDYSQKAPLPRLERLHLAFESGERHYWGSQPITSDMVHFLESICYGSDSRTQFRHLDLEFTNWRDEYLEFKCTKELKGRLQRLYDGGLFICINGNRTPIPDLLIQD